MKIKRLYIGDFGILRNQTLEGIHPGIVVIGGLNRAGKSTFMEVLRYLGYGFPKGRGLPPASGKYEAEADIRLDIGDVYNLRLSGYAEPVIKRISGAQEEIMNAKELYGLDNFTYGQLFTITLDELQKNQGISSDDKRRLQSILLGAGFSDMLVIPRLEQEFYKEGDKIGGKKGSPKVKQFKPYYQSIEKGIKVKQKGLGQVEEYQQKQGELREKEKATREINKEIEELQNQVVQLDVIKNNYSTYLEIEKLEAELIHSKAHGWEETLSEYELETMKSLRDEYNSLNKVYQEKEIELGIHASLRDKLINNKEHIAGFMAGVSGIQERIRQYGQQMKEYHRRKQDIVTRIKDSNSSWDESDIQMIAHIKTDQIKHNRLIEMVERHRGLESEFKNHVDALNKLEDEYNILKGRAERVKDAKPWMGVKKYFYSSLAFVMLGLILSFMNPLLGVLFGIAGIAGTAIYLILRALDSKDTRRVDKDIKNEVDDKQVEMDTEQRKLDDVVSELDIITKELDDNKKILGISHETSYNILPGYLDRIMDIQSKLSDLDRMFDELKGDRNFIEDKFASYSGFISQFDREDVYELADSDGDFEDGWNKIILGLERWSGFLSDAQEIKILQQRIDAIEQKLSNIIEKYKLIQESFTYGDFDEAIAMFIEKGEKAIEHSKVKAALEVATQTILYSMGSDGIRRAFNSSQEVNLLNIFKEKCMVYTSEEQTQETYSKLSRELDAKLNDLEKLKESRQTLEDELRRLAAIENLTRGQRQIDNGRAELKVLADQYAVNMMSAFLLREAGNSLLEGMKDSIMDSAGNIFNRMTGGQYKGILPSEPLWESDFQAILHDDANPETIDMLSRGTREQLYLSVRLSRIMDIKPNLPIIIDDSFANFDSLHLGQSINILAELSKTHQIFILTCHGDLVEEIAKSECDAQYWKLDEGKLGASGFEELAGHLSRT